jgi:hypothetical protein
MPTSPPFVAQGGTDVQQNAELALYLLRLLEQRRDSQQRLWLGEDGLLTLRHACHVLEALHDLNLKGLTQHLAEPATNWLIALPLDLPAEDLRPYRLFPSRLKILAQAGRFDAARLMPDLDSLTQHFDPATGWMRDAPIDLHPTLVTLIWLDTLHHLDSQGLLPAAYHARREQALAALQSTFEAWVAQAAAEQPTGQRPAEAAGPRPGDLANPADSSYAFDLLCRLGRLRADSPPAEASRQLCLAALRDQRPAALNRSDRLYCAIHLQQRYPHQAETRDVVQTLLSDLRQRYANDDCQREPVSYHALVLRLVVAHHGEALRAAVLEKLWQDSLASAEAEQRQAQAQLEAEFVELIRQTIRVTLSPPQRLTGTSERGQVYRLRFGLATESTDEHGAPLSTPRDTLRLIVKQGPPDVLARAIRRYRELPEPLQHLFARHAALAEDQAPGYLVMQDLAEMQPLSEVLGQLDRPVILPDERRRTAAEIAGAVSGVLRALHDHERRPSILGHQLDVVYLAPMAGVLERLAQPLAFPELKQWLDGPLSANRRRYRPLDWYLHQLRRHEAQLSPPSLGFVHGDCHSRNLMLSRDLAQCKFVDIETLAGAEDYVVDYGLLLEDVAVYQSLPYGSERGRLEWDDIRTTRATGPARPPDNFIAYPAFPRSEGVVAFQAELLRQLRAYAETLGDEGWQPRLWLAIARGLLLLASRQLTSHSVEPHRRSRGPRYVNDAKLVQVAYAEALRLLRELTEHLSARGGAPLPELPFPGEHRLPPAQLPPPVAALLEALGQGLGESAERRPVDGRPSLTDYVTRPGQHLFARVRARRSAPVLYLAGRPEQLNDPQHLAAPLRPGDAHVAAPGLGSRVALVPDVPVDSIMDLVRQAQQLADHAD